MTAHQVPRLEHLTWDKWPTRFVFFTGKGGVGKTTVACTTAVHLADAGQRILLVSTDPASNLAEVLGDSISKDVRAALPEVPMLDCMNLDPVAAAKAYRERVIGPYRATLPPAELAALTEQLAGACTVEVAAFDTFARLLTAPQVRERYDHILFDTAPTGHTLRLLSLPAAWAGYLTTSPGGASCLGPAAALDAERSVFEAAVAALGDETLTTLVLVARPDRPSLREAERAGDELGGLGITRRQLVINGILTDPLPGDPVAEGYAAAQADALEALPPSLANLATAQVPLVGKDLTGVAALRSLAASEPAAPAPATAATAVNARSAELPGLDDLVDSLAAGPAQAVLVTGKGGVGKTTVATAVALELAERGLSVHLSTTDPAGQLPELEDMPTTLTVSRIDPGAETDQLIARRMQAGRNLAEERRALLEEELRSPCTTEMAVFHAFSELLLRARKQFVVIDTAPSGHTLLLLDLTGDYHRQAMRSLGDYAGRATTPLMRLQNPDYTRLIIVTLPETTPVSEAEGLQGDLRRAGIEPYGWVINASIAATSTSDPVLRRRAELEGAHIQHVSSMLAKRLWVTPWTKQTAAGLRRKFAGAHS